MQFSLFPIIINKIDIKSAMFCGSGLFILSAVRACSRCCAFHPLGVGSL